MPRSSVAEWLPRTGNRSSKPATNVIVFKLTALVGQGTEAIPETIERPHDAYIPL